MRIVVSLFVGGTVREIVFDVFHLTHLQQVMFDGPLILIGWHINNPDKVLAGLGLRQLGEFFSCIRCTAYAVSAVVGSELVYYAIVTHTGGLSPLVPLVTVPVTALIVLVVWDLLNDIATHKHFRAGPGTVQPRDPGPDQRGELFRWSQLPKTARRRVAARLVRTGLGAGFGAATALYVIWSVSQWHPHI